METAIEFEPEATRCRACIGTGMAQCDACSLADAACDACGEPAELLHGDERLPLCAKCGSDNNERKDTDHGKATNEAGRATQEAEGTTAHGDGGRAQGRAGRAQAEEQAPVGVRSEGTREGDCAGVLDANHVSVLPSRIAASDRGRTIGGGIRLVPLVAEPPTESISALAACIVSTHGLVSPRLCDPDEATVVEVRRGN